MRFRVYQQDGSPARWGVQAIVYEHPEVGWVMVTNGDYYIRVEDRIIAVDRVGQVEYVINQWESVLEVFAGRTISNREFQGIYQQAKADMNFAKKTGYLPGEKKES